VASDKETTVTGEEINAALVDQHRHAQEAVQPLLEENNRLREENARLRAGWLLMLRNQNECDARMTGHCSVTPDRCACIAEMEQWMKDESAPL